MTREEALRLLELPEGFTDAELTTAYRRAAKKNHPDLGGSPEVMRKLNEAKAYLSDPANNRKMRVTHNGILDVTVC